MYRLFGIDTLLICGGGTINWTFLQQGAVDELILMIAPAADGSPDSVTVFEQSDFLPDNNPVEFQLKNVEQTKGSGIRLVYTVSSKSGEMGTNHKAFFVDLLRMLFLYAGSEQEDKGACGCRNSQLYLGKINFQIIINIYFDCIGKKVDSRCRSRLHVIDQNGLFYWIYNPVLANSCFAV